MGARRNRKSFGCVESEIKNTTHQQIILDKSAGVWYNYVIERRDNMTCNTCSYCNKCYACKHNLYVSEACKDCVRNGDKLSQFDCQRKEICKMKGIVK